MDSCKLKEEMKRLWKETFHDSDDYINLVFDAYFSPDFVAWHESDGRIVSALMGVPYTFRQGSRFLRALYLCGLATEPAFRRMGIMDSLLDEINRRAVKMGFSLSFLIPADEGLHVFYQNRGYSFAMFRVPDRCVSSHDFGRAYLNILNAEPKMTGRLKMRYYNTLCVERLDRIVDMHSDTTENIDILSGEKIDFSNGMEVDSDETVKVDSDNDMKVDFKSVKNVTENATENIAEKVESELYDFGGNISTESAVLLSSVYKVMRMCETNNDYPVLSHTPADFLTAVRENILSGGEVVCCRSRCDQVPTGLAFVTFSDGEIIVPYILSSDRCSLFKMLDFIKLQHPGMPMTVYRFPEQIERKGVTGEYYAGFMKGAPLVGTVNVVDRVSDISAKAPVYGMARILSLSEILKFLRIDLEDPKYSILVKGENRELHIGKSENSTNHSSLPITLTMRQLQEVLFRHKDTDPMLGDLLGLPRLPLNMALLLD